MKSVNYLHRREGGFKDHCIAQNAALFVDYYKISFVRIMIIILPLPIPFIACSKIKRGEAQEYLVAEPPYSYMYSFFSGFS